MSNLRNDLLSESLRLPYLEGARPAPRRGGLRARLALAGEVVTGGLVELWAHKMRSILTLTLLMLGVFALVVMASVLDGVKDKISTGFAGMSWDGTMLVAPREAKTEEQKRLPRARAATRTLARLTAARGSCRLLRRARRRSVTAAPPPARSAPSSLGSPPTTPG
jgi:putative ABC transport system permease protein